MPRISLVPIVLFASLAGCRDRATPDRGAATEPPPSSSPPALVATASSPSSAPVAPSAPLADTASPVAEKKTPPEMVSIPAGIFLMGSPVGASPEEQPMHEVIVAGFDLDRTEVTVRAYKACLASGACPKPHQGNPFCNDPGDESRADHPINCIDWAAAEAYCKSVGKRLPTEREWEYAARGGAEQRRYSWGAEDPTPERSCYLHVGTCKVGSFAPGAFGLHDVSGNVWEWTSSWYGNYPHEPKEGRYKIYRGGSWSRRFPKWLQNGLRNRYLPEEWSASVGVRCARSQSPLACPADAEAKDGVCVRVRGTPLCPPGHAWNGEGCTPGGAKPVKGAKVDDGAAPPQRAEEPPKVPAEEQPITITRTPEHDGDCQAHWPKSPNAYRFSGATFHKRNGPLGQRGCTRRDMGQTWTSACCPQ